MTLAVILFVSIFCPSAHTPLVSPRQSTDQSTTVATPASAPATQDSSQPAQSSAQPAKSTASPQTQTPPAKKSVTARPRRRKKKLAASNCVPASAATTATPAGAASPADPTHNPSNGVSTNQPPATAPTVCPPPKTVVRQGGTSEPAIQLAGGAVGDQAAQQRHTANEMLSATELNLKKVDETKLTVSQQDTLNQIHQFMDQSKSAAAAGDLERARTLAWKAQLLSEELISPQK
jgi:hypothetical protein